MPLRRYRHINDVPSSLVVEGGPAVGLRLACELSTLALRLAGDRPPSGVYRHRSLVDAQWHRSSAEPSSDAIDGGR